MRMNLYEIRNFANLLERGVDPTSGIKFETDTIITNPQIVEYNRIVKELIDQLILIGDGKNILNMKNRKIPFFLLEDEKEQIKLSDQPVSISEFCYIVNKYVPKGMKKIRAAEITKKLEEKNFLQSVIWREDKYIKVPTENGKKLGITTLEKINPYGNKYSVNYYNKSAQKFILFEIL